MKLTAAHKKAGIVEISPMKNFNGSYTCVVIISKIDRESNGTNFRKWSQAHTNELTGTNYLREAVRNPILKWCKDTKKLKSIDGRHTIAGLDDRQEETCTADVHFTMDDALAGKVFFELTQNSKRMAPWDAYAAAIQGNYQFALDIDAALLRFGFTTPNDPGYNSRSADFNGFTPLKDSHDLGVKFLHTFLTALLAWKGKGRNRLEDDARKNVFQRGLMDFLAEYSELFTARDFASRLGRRTASEITALAIKIAPCERVERGHFKQAFEMVMQMTGARLRLAA